jgi:AcrR family transcriptional regulator
MISETRARLVNAASDLFAEHGYRGASVRDICNIARANPGAVSYHFGGKRQLYRTVLRQAAGRLADLFSGGEEDSEVVQDRELQDVVRTVFLSLQADAVATRLLLRDLADGGSLAVEALGPTLRRAVDALRRALGHPETPRASAEARQLFLEIAAPIFLLSAGWPAVAPALDLSAADRMRLFDQMMERILG